MSGRSRIIVASSVQRECVEWLWPGRVPLGSVTLLVGDPGLGKSTLALELAARLSTGRLPCGEGTALVATAEDHLAATVRPRLEAAQANLERVGFVVMDRDETEDFIRLPEDVPELEAAVAEEEARLVVVDPLMAPLGGAVDSWKDQSIRSAVAPLHRLAERHGCAVLAVAHLTKARTSDPLTRTGGSIGLPAAARSALLLARDPDDEEGEQGSRRVLAHWKSNLAPLAPSLVYELQPVLIPARDADPEVETSRIVEVGESTYVGRDLLGTIGDEERDALTEAEAFLRDELAYGPVDVRELKRSAGNAGLSWTTVERAKKKLGIARPGSVKRVGGIAGEGHWTWELPKTVTLRPSREPEADDGLSETPHQQRENGASPTPEVAYDRHAHALTALGERELQEWRNEAARRVLEERDRRQAEKDAVLSFDDVGTAPLADLQRAHEEGRL